MLPSILPHREITIEANPEQLTEKLAHDLASIGINRISIGIQSLNDSELKILGRTHNSAQAKKAVHNAYQAGIQNITIDLMYELPTQTLNSWQKTLDQLQELPITHLSLYNLTIEPDTAFYRKKEQLQRQIAPSETCKEMLDLAIEKLSALGLQRYEISAFAKPGYEAIHNTGYWTGEPFIGLGPSAFSFTNGERYRNACNFPKYLNSKTRIDFREKLPYPDNLNELLAIHLRLLKGVNISAFEERWGKLPTKTHRTLTENTYIDLKENHARLSSQGLLFYDTIATEII
ncbi:MAG: coproporphyrinogen-III oxidase family protein [Candidatus Algichlamydia australiensis]|nr:coproporphyrinogen-III oxidase family protein [Chlamydiales bacterium]